MKVSLVTLEKTLFESDNVVHVQLPTTEGEIGVYDNHVPLISRLGRGSVLIEEKRKDEPKLIKHNFTLADGVIEVRADNSVVLLASVAEPTDTELAEYAQEKLAEAKERAAATDIDEASRKRAQKLLAIEEARYKTHKRRK